MKTNFLFSFIFLLLISSSLLAQNAIVGTVKDADGNALPSVTVYVLNDGIGDLIGTTTSNFGDYKLNVGNLNTVTVRYSYTGFEAQDKVFTFYENKTRVENIVLAEKVETISFTVTAKKDPKYGAMTKIDPKDADKVPLGGIEKLAVLTGMGANATNELSSQFTVRGGNYDENLVYVNDFEIYRQFLVRSGQQEGLSFINPDMVASVDFSTGGFEAKYGDKLSSVLDVKYKKPKDFGGSVSASLLGYALSLEGRDKSDRLTYVVGFRQQSNSYLLNALPAQGQYRPRFLDFQAFFTYQLTSNWQLQYISNSAQNQFKFLPEYEERRFGDPTNAFQLSIFFEGGENDTYTSSMNGLGTSYTSNDGKLNLKFQTSLYSSVETEAFDIIGQYYIGEVESNLGDNTFGSVISSSGIGTYHNWARNRLTARMINTVHRGYLDKDDHFISWGLRFQNEEISDKIDEWNRIDSAGYALPYEINTVPYVNSEVSLNRTLKSENSINSNRISGFIQDSWNFGASDNFNITAGTRFNYWDVNKEFFVTPRVQFYYKPNRTVFKGDESDTEQYNKWKYKRDSTNVSYRFALGTYYQPPFYRELRNLQGLVNTNVKAQKSLHAVFGVDYNFHLWKRPFKFTTELYYKHLWDLVPYDIENVLIRYYGDNIAKGFAYGVDFRIYGQFVKGVDSWVTLSLLNTKEDLINDAYWKYTDSLGVEVSNPVAFAEQVVDSSYVEPGFLRRPTDQRFSFSIFFQDYLPDSDKFKVSVNMVYASGLPFSPPNNLRYRNVLTSPPYTRVDIGFSAMLFSKSQNEDISSRRIVSKFSDIWASIEVFNLLANNNVISYSWVSNFQGTQYAIPNRLTARRLNAKLVFKF